MACLSVSGWPQGISDQRPSCRVPARADRLRGSTVSSPTLGELTVEPRSRSARAGTRHEGRWSLIPWGHPDTERHAIACPRLLLHRYGVVTRLLALWAHRSPAF